MLVEDLLSDDPPLWYALAIDFLARGKHVYFGSRNRVLEMRVDGNGFLVMRIERVPLKKNEKPKRQTYRMDGRFSDKWSIWKLDPNREVDAAIIAKYGPGFRIGLSSNA